MALSIMIAGCKKKIGDSCTVNVDCATDGSRICDRSSPGGYCTREGCSGGGCPKEAVCVAFFPVLFLNQPCNPDTEDLLCDFCDPQAGDQGCNAFCDTGDLLTSCEPCDPDGGDTDCNAFCDPAPSTDDCLPDEICLVNGYCAPKSTERRFCMRKCSKNSDCRGAYECRRTGVDGAFAAPKIGAPYSTKEVKYCAARR